MQNDVWKEIVAYALLQKNKTADLEIVQVTRSQTVYEQTQINSIYECILTAYK